MPAHSSPCEYDLDKCFSPHTNEEEEEEEEEEQQQQQQQQQPQPQPHLLTKMLSSLRSSLSTC